LIEIKTLLILLKIKCLKNPSFLICFKNLFYIVNNLTEVFIGCELKNEIINQIKAVHSVPVKKMKVEVFDESGNKYTVSVEGKVYRKSAIRILDMVELLGGIPTSEMEPQRPEELSKINKVKSIIEKNFPSIAFSAHEAQTVYNNELGEQMDLSTISTYLSRLSDKGLLIKEKNAHKVVYKLVSEGIRNIVENH